MSITTPIMYHGMYAGSMTNHQADLILATREMKVVPALKNIIYDFPYELVLEAISAGTSVREYAKENNIDISKYIGSLKDYQTVGTAFMYLSPRSIIADGCGLGKTAEIAGLINFLHLKGEMKRVLMAVENSAVGQTTAELMRFTGLNIVALPSEKAKLNKMIKNTDWSKVDGMVIKHSALRSDALFKWIALNLSEDGTACRLFDTFILDESSVIKNNKTKTFEYTQHICKLSRRVHMMNATAFETNILDVYYQMDMMNTELLPKAWRIEKEYCTFGRTSYWTKENGKAKMNWRRERSGYKNQSKFKESLKLVYFGRSKKDVGLDLPHIHKVYEVEPTNEQSIALTKGYRYNEVLNCPSLISDLNIPTDRKHVPKMERTVQLIENEFSSDKVMIFCFHREAQKKLAEELEKIGRKPIILSGEVTDADERYRIQQMFNTGEKDVIITNIKKSLNLYGGDVCIFYSVLTNPATMFQAASRIDRNVDDKIKTFVLLLYKGTDEYNFFVEKVKNRAKDSRDLTLDAKTTVDFFIESMKESEAEELGL